MGIRRAFMPGPKPSSAKAKPKQAVTLPTPGAAVLTHSNHWAKPDTPRKTAEVTAKYAPCPARGTAPVDGIAERARKEAFRLAQEEALTYAQERDAQRKLAHRLIDIGYEVLAKENPDKMRGDREAIQRLNKVRDKLKHSI